ncbi:glucan endo-1,3-alpha-glucosidase agn1 [Phlyctema vagabunda]|uniref:Glucan endo-1,3-alpha-glucosidase agn1 n=1 Tax=Phlyctema vagabunda TaxID=108571 RepID=A0ABR4PLX2_9HELO
MRVFLFLSVLLSGYQVHAYTVFAHFMVGNTKKYSVGDWEDDITEARASHIDGFALNLAFEEAPNEKGVANAFQAAKNLGSDFKLFFSFDYLGMGPWTADSVVDLVNQYSGEDAYFKRGSKPLVSTFEGTSPASIAEWPVIKEKTNCFFVPSWSSMGAKGAMNSTAVDGLFSWAAWPDGPRDMTDSIDETYLHYLQNKTYMMPVSPWFYTNLPGYEKNWLWRGDDLWYDRWQEVLSIRPEFVQILTWNDYGESHYIGPLRNKAYKAFKDGDAPYNYAKNMPHDGWRVLLPYLIDMYKSGSASIPQESLVSWYRLAKADRCTDGGTTGNSGNQGQTTFIPTTIVQDKIFFSALLESPASVSISIGGVNITSTWENTPDGEAGIYHGSVDFGDNLGEVIVEVSRDGHSVARVVGESIDDSCPHNIQNYNAWVGSDPTFSNLGSIDRPPLLALVGITLLMALAGASLLS